MWSKCTKSFGIPNIPNIIRSERSVIRSSRKWSINWRIWVSKVSALDFAVLQHAKYSSYCKHKLSNFLWSFHVKLFPASVDAAIIKCRWEFLRAKYMAKKRKIRPSGSAAERRKPGQKLQKNGPSFRLVGCDDHCEVSDLSLFFENKSLYLLSISVRKTVSARTITRNSPTVMAMENRLSSSNKIQTITIALWFSPPPMMTRKWICRRFSEAHRSAKSRLRSLWPNMATPTRTQLVSFLKLISRPCSDFAFGLFSYQPSKDLEFFVRTSITERGLICDSTAPWIDAIN